MLRPSRIAAAFLLLLALVASCSTDSSVQPPDEPVPTVGDTASANGLNFLQPAVGAPTIANPVVTFYAKAGESREAFMYYRKRADRNDSTVFVRFRVPKDALFQRPDGSAFAPGDSVLITITLLDPARLEVGFEPSGLKFSPTDPARLKISFLETDEDRNDDGSVDAKDTAILTMLALWKREASNQPWVRQTSLLSAASHEIEADVFGFTGYVIAW